jgi:isopropylmalate/homocitrate/citramalate synthase
MNAQKRTPKSHKRWTAEHDEAIRQLSSAAQRVEESDTPDTRAELAEAVEAAREAGVGWTKIGDTLGIASGNAYQRYRQRPGSSGGRHPRACYESAPHRDAGEPDC